MLDVEAAGFPSAQEGHADPRKCLKTHCDAKIGEMV
jgi:hypothetical protein